MADVNIKLRRGALSTLPTTKTDGHLYFATVDDTAASDDKKYTGYIYLDSNGQRYSFGKYVEYADQAGSATTAGTAGEADHAGSADTATTANSATTAGKLTTAQYIDGMSFNGTADIHHYTTCSTAAGTAAKTASLSGFALKNGARVIVKFTNANTATSNVTLNIQSTGAKKITYKGNDLTATDSWEAGTTIEFVYNGTSWEMLSSGSGKAIYDGNGNVISDTYATKNQGIYYIEGTGSTAGTWLGSHDDITTYYNGLTILYKVPVAGASTTTLNINNFGAKTVIRNASSKVTTNYGVDSVVLLTYTTDETTGYWKIADYDANTNTQLRVYRQTSGYDADTYPLLVSRTAAGSIGTAGTNAGYAGVYGVFRENSDNLPTLRANPAKGIIFANTFKGNLEGNADSATMATNADKDSAGNVIADFYMPKSGGQFTGPISFKDEAALPQKNLEYLVGIDDLDSGGEVGYQAASGISVGYASTAGTANHASTAAKATEADRAGYATTAGSADEAGEAGKLATPVRITVSAFGASGVSTFDGSTDIKIPLSNHSMELNSEGGLPSYGGFIDFHYHNANGKPLNSAGEEVATTPDYTSRIIENAAGQISVNSVLFKNGKMTAQSLETSGDAKVNGALNAAGITTLGSTLDVTGAVTLNSTLSVAGKTTVKQLLISDQNAISHVAFSRGSLNYITAPSSGSIAFIPNGGSIGEANSNLVIRGVNLEPGATNKFSLGTDSRRWKNIYGNILNISGASTFTGAITASGGITGNVTGNLIGNADSATYATSAGEAATAVTAESADIANGLTELYLQTLDTRYDAKYMKDYTILLYNGNNGTNAIKFATVDYSTCTSENGVSAKIGMVSGHGNGVSYTFLQDAIIRVNYTGTVEVDNFKYYGATATYDGTRQYGDIFYTVDTTNKKVDLYCVMGQYSRLYQTPWKRLTYSTGGTVTQHTTATIYSSGTKTWGKNSDIAMLSDIPTNFVPIAGGTITGSLEINGGLTVGADASIGGDLTVTGLLTATSGVKGNLDGNAKTADAFSSGTTVTLTGDVTGTSASSVKGWSIATSLPYRLKNYQTSSGLNLTNPNDALETGFYYINGATNRPSFGQSTNNDYRILTTAYSNIWGQQIATDFRCNDIFYRRIQNGTWQEWVQFITSENLESRAKQVLDDDYVNVSGDTMTGILNLNTANAAQMNFRPGHATYDGVISYQTSGNEAMVFSTKNAVTSFMFVNGEDTITNVTASRWQSLTPGLQIKNNCVSIGELIANGATPTYKLKVAGATNITGDTTLNSALTVGGVTTLGSTLDVTGATTINSTLDVAGRGTFVGLTSTSDNMFIAHGNEFNFIPDGYSNTIYINYQTVSRNSSGAVSSYVFLTGNGSTTSYADLQAKNAIFDGNLTVKGNTILGDANTDNTTIYGYLYKKGDSTNKGHIYLDGAASASINNTTQIIFREGTTEHIALSSNDDCFVINPTSTSSSPQIALYLGVNATSSIPGGLSLGKQLSVGTNATIGGTLTLTKTQDLSGTANNSPALIIGGAATSTHMEIDCNEIQAKTNGTSVAALYLNNDGGLVTIGSGGLTVGGLITANGGVKGNVTGDLTGTASKATADADGNTISSTYLKKSGGTMTGQLLTSFKSSVAIGSYASSASTVEALVEEIRYSSGAMGSISITTAYTNGSNTISTGWYNYVYTPHRVGGLNGSANGDNHQYGTLMLYGMTINDAHWRIRVASGAIAEVARIIELDTAYSTLGYLKKSGDTMIGNLTIANGSVQIRKESPTASSWYNGRDNALIRHVAYTGYNPILSSKTTDGSWELGPYTNNYLYFVYNTDEGYESGTNTTGEYFNSVKLSPTGGLYGAVWNDYAEFRDQSEDIEPGYCVASADNGKVYRTTKRLQACDGIVSDTFGFAIGEDENCKTPLAVAGRVLAYCYGDRNDYHSGDVVCAGPDGKVSKMTREEIREWPDRIVGIVSEIPNYETWGGHNTKVNNRIWINVK